MGHDHAHGPAADLSGAHAGRLRWALALTGSFLMVELAAAWITGSLALLSDAAHMLTDVAALAIALAAVRIGRRPADSKRTFGYYRFEILAAAVNALMLFAVALYIGWEAWQRFRTPHEVASLPMLLVAVVGLVINFIALRLLSGASEQSLNVKGAYLEVWSDMLGSLGVIAAAIIMWLTAWQWVDSAVALAIALWVLPRTWTLLKDVTNVLLQGVPRGTDIQALEALLRARDGVKAVHALHVWALGSGRLVMSVHLVVQPALLKDMQFLQRLNEELASRFGLRHTTIQLESADAQTSHGEH